MPDDGLRPTDSGQGRDAYDRLLTEIRTGTLRPGDRLTETDLAARLAYVNSAGKPFDDEVGDILLHVMLHGQYHRGKINLLLRQGGAEPGPVDYIAFTRGSATARTEIRRTE